jgi:hypothetical protein
VAHGGDLALIETSAEGAVFELRLPGAPPPAPAPARRTSSSA